MPPRRTDGTPVGDVSPLRRIIPYVMRTRTESVVYYPQQIDLTRTLPFLERWRARHGDKLTLFDIVVTACGRALHEWPGMNRFVAGGHLYQRHKVEIAFALHKRADGAGSMATVKLEIPAGSVLAEVVARLHACERAGRTSEERGVDRTIGRFATLTGWPLRAVAAGVRWLDAWGALPVALTEVDPMYSSMFLANLGSVGLERAYHHLYEHGTASAFGVLGRIGKEVVVDAHGVVGVRDGVTLNWTFDERINDGAYCAQALACLRRYIEDPALLERETLLASDVRAGHALAQPAS